MRSLIPGGTRTGAAVAAGIIVSIAGCAKADERLHDSAIQSDSLLSMSADPVANEVIAKLSDAQKAAVAAATNDPNQLVQGFVRRLQKAPSDPRVSPFLADTVFERFGSATAVQHASESFAGGRARLEAHLAP